MYLQQNDIKMIKFITQTKIQFTSRRKSRLERKKLVGKKGHGKIEYVDCGINHGLFLAPKLKYFVTNNEYGMLGKKPYTGFQDAGRILERKKYFDSMERDTISGNF